MSADVQARKIVLRKLADLEPYERNARQHSDEQIEQLVASIREFGWTTPMLVDGNSIIAGHGRRHAALKLGLERVPCIDVKGLSEAQKRALIIADNKLAENATWDVTLLAAEMSDLDAADFDMSAVGFNDADLAKLLEPTAADPAAAWQGMPEFEQQDHMAFRTVKVHFNDDESVAKFAELLQQTITPQTRFVWFPMQVPVSVADQRYVAAEPA